MDEIERKQLVALRQRRKAKGMDVSDLPPLEVKGESGTFSTDTWPGGLYVSPLVSGRGTPAHVYMPNSDMGFPRNSAIYACLNTVATAFREAVLDIYRENDSEGGRGEWQLVQQHPIRRLLRKPNQISDEREAPVALPISVMGWINQWNKHVDGNSYWIKIRSGHPVYGNVIAVWPIPPYMMTPVAPGEKDDPLKVRGTITRPSQTWIDYYEYDPYPGVVKPQRIDPRNVVHFRLGVDPGNYRKGLGPVKMLAREIASDELADQFTNSLLRNSAIPGLIVVPEDGWVDDDVAQQVKARMREEFGNGNQGGIAVLSAGAKVEQFGFDPQSMSLLAIHKHCEERIAAVMNVPAIVAQLGAGLEQSAQFTNFHEAREMFAEDTMLPLWEADSDTLTAHLLSDFTSQTTLALRYDVTHVRALQQDQSQLYGRLQVGVKGGWLTANEARARVGLPPIDAKEQQVPLTQGEDNRFNIMVELGLVTLNEVRESIGLPPIEGGDVMLKDIPGAKTESPPGPEGSPDGGLSPLSPGQEQAPLPGTRGAPEPVPSDRRPGGDIPEPPSADETMNEGSNIVRRQKALELLEQVMTPDELLQLKREAKAAGLALVDVAPLVLEQ